jgi:hypothetical protein
MLRSGHAPCAGELEVTIAVVLPHHRLLVLIEGIIGTATSSSIVEPGRLGCREAPPCPVPGSSWTEGHHGPWAMDRVRGLFPYKNNSDSRENLTTFLGKPLNSSHFLFRS